VKRLLKFLGTTLPTPIIESLEKTAIERGFTEPPPQPGEFRRPAGKGDRYREALKRKAKTSKAAGA
jgi:hypothetical protein